MENICVSDIYGVVWSVCLLCLRLATIFSFSCFYSPSRFSCYIQRGPWSVDCFSRVTVVNPTSISMPIRINSVCVILQWAERQCKEANPQTMPSPREYLSHIFDATLYTWIPPLPSATTG
jgi:hypothetical protein